MDYNHSIDFSTLSAYLDCPRKALFKYVLCLQIDGPPSIDLIFGSCWHIGMEAGYKAFKTDPSITIEDLTEISTAAFWALWNIEAAPFYDADSTFPKSPSRAMEMYYKYWSLFRAVDMDKKVVSVEEPFALHVRDDLPLYVGRKDVELQSDRLEVHEHKTSKYNTAIIFAGYKASLQAEGYLTVSYVYQDTIPVIVYNQALCQKNKIDFTRFEVTKKKSAIERFLDDYISHTERFLRELEVYRQFAQLPQAQQRDSILPCFHRAPGYACTMYFRECEYLDLCQMRNNPLTYLDKVPQGYRIEEWNPEDHAQKSDEILKEVMANV